MTRTRPVRAVVGAALLSALALAGCSTPLPTPAPDPEPAAVQPALSEEQVERVLEDIGAVLAAADEARDPALLESRVTGPALRYRTVEYTLATAGDAEAITPVPSEAQTVIAPATRTWPRTVMVVTEQPDDLQPPLLLTLVQDGPRDPLRLWSWVRLFPGVQTPVTARPDVGSPPVDPASADLAVPPAEVVTRYVDVLTSGDGSAFVGTFGDDPLRAGIASTRDAFTQLVGENGSLAETYVALPDSPGTLATADGGAIVVGAFETLTTITLVDSTLTLGDETATLLGAPTVASNLSITWLSVVAFAVPPAGSDAPVQPIGAEHARVQVTGG